MAAGTTPIFPIAVNSGAAGSKVSAANTALDGTGTIVLLFTAGANGAIVEKVSAMHMGTNVASTLRILKNDGLGLLAANFNLLKDLAIPAYTLAQTTSSFAGEILLNAGSGYGLKAGEKLYATTGVVLAAGWMVTTIGGGDY